MKQVDLLDYKKNVFSQNGEDGIIEYIFDNIGTRSKTCCEFGAWDGIHLSNCRNLILHGWQAVMIEGDREKHALLRNTYRDNPLVKTVHRFVDTTNNTLDNIFRDLNITSLDFLSIDIDGLDCQIFEGLEIRPTIICIEVNAGHDPQSHSEIPIEIARHNVGQSLPIFVDIAVEKGYSLVCYTANAFFVRQEICREYSLPSLSGEIVYMNFLQHLTTSEREWLYLVNRGIVPPYYQFHNHRLLASALGISEKRAIVLRVAAMVKQFLIKKIRQIRNIF